ncbi:hypothetical protein [Streptomyces sp. NPDC000618]|uniref:hypothetical protein n=1 Tax=Streptomyces sp. NPDC000618 TaxID=3154265 RepID=UPI00332CCA43
MTRENHQSGELTSDEVPHHQSLLDCTDWASLGTARGDAKLLPAVLSRLLDPDPTVQIRAISELEPVCHQNSFYEATLSVSLYVASILAHPATAAVGPDRPTGPERGYPVRAALLDWLGSLAYDADDECLAIGERHFYGDYLADYAEMRAFRDHRPAFYRAVSPFLSDEHMAVREAAIVAALPLIEHPDLTRHRNELGLRVHRLLADSTNRYSRSRCLDALKNWGYDTTALESAADVAARTRHVRGGDWTGGYMDEPPF